MQHEDIKKEGTESPILEEIAKLDSELARYIAEELEKPKSQQYQGTGAPGHAPAVIGEQFSPTIVTYRPNRGREGVGIFQPCI